jgi:hypothetical protein
MVSFSCFHLFCFVALAHAKICAEFQVNSCPTSGFVFFRGSLAPGSSGLSKEDLLTFTIANADKGPFTREPLVGFNCIPSESSQTSIDSRDWMKTGKTCGTSADAEESVISFPLREGALYAGAGTWTLGFSACGGSTCALNVTVQLLQGACMNDWVQVSGTGGAACTTATSSGGLRVLPAAAAAAAAMTTLTVLVGI